MNNLDEQYESLYEFIKNLETLLQKMFSITKRLKKLVCSEKNSLIFVKQESSI